MNGGDTRPDWKPAGSPGGALRRESPRRTSANRTVRTAVRRCIDGAERIGHSLRNWWWRAVTPPRAPVYSREWDVLNVVDACRPDALRRVAPEYDYHPLSF